MWTRERSPVVTAHHSRPLSSSHGPLYGNKGTLRGVKLAASSVAEAMVSGPSVHSPSPSPSPLCQMPPIQLPPPPLPGSSGAPIKRQNAQELRGELFAMLEPSQQVAYCAIVSKFLNAKMSKAELDKLLPATIGSENISRHNRLIRAVFSNACSMEAARGNRGAKNENLEPRISKGVLRKRTANVAQLANEGMQKENVSGRPPTLRMNGEAMTYLSKKPRSPERRESEQRCNFAGGMEEDREEAEFVFQNGAVALRDGMDRFEEEGTEGSSRQPLAKRVRLDRDSQNENMKLHSGFEFDGMTRLSSRDGPEGVPFSDFNADTIRGRKLIRPGLRKQDEETEEMEEDEDGDEDEDGVWLKSRIRPPLGIPFCKSSPGGSASVPSSQFPDALRYGLLGEPLDSDSCPGDLPDDAALQRRMQRLVHMEGGLQAISSDAVQAVGIGLETFVKSVAAACIRLVKTRRRKEQKWQEECGGKAGVVGSENRQSVNASSKVNNSSNNNNNNNGPTVISGVWPHRATSGQSVSRGGGTEGQGNHEMQQNPSITVQDLMVAVELNPRMLGDDMAFSLERIASYL